MISTGMAEAKSSIRSTLALAFHLRQQTVDQFDQPDFHFGDGARRQRAGNGAAHMGVQGRVVEDEARGVMLE